MSHTPSSDRRQPEGARPHRGARRVAVGLVLFTSCVLASVLVAPRTRVPVLMVGTAAMGLLLPLVVVALLASVASGVLLRRRRTAVRWLALVLSVASLVGGVVTTAQQTTLAHREGVDVDWSGALLGTDAHDTAPDVDVPAYTHAQGHDVGLSVWKPAGSSGPAPVLVHVHGGGWGAGSRLDDKAHARWFADHGYLVVSVDYSLSDATHHNWNVQEPQVACALTWVGRHAAEYGGDATRLGMTGSSAGGNLASSVASKVSSGALATPCGTLPVIRAVGSLYGASDLLGIWNHAHPLLRNSLHRMAVTYTGGTPEQYTERYQAVSSLNAVTTKTPPTLWVYGDADSLVPPQTMDALVEVLQSRGVDAHGIRIPQANHGLDFRNSIQQQIWRQSALAWFRDHGVR